MPKKELKKEIYEFLCANTPERFNLMQLSRETKISYPSILKWVEVLIAEKRDPPVNIEDHGSIKFVWIEK